MMMILVMRNSNNSHMNNDTIMYNDINSDSKSNNSSKRGEAKPVFVLHLIISNLYNVT